MNKKKWSHVDSLGKILGTVLLEQLWVDTYGLCYSKPEKRLSPKIWSELFAQAKNRSLEWGALKINCRIRKDYDPETFRSLLQDLGFAKKSERIEYKADLLTLPQEQNTPLSWKTAQELSWNVQQVADFFSKVTFGALDIDPDEKPEDFIQDFLKHDELTSGFDCIGLGFLGQVPCAAVVAQVEKSSGWSRLSYMGLLPSYRGQGLGKWIHRHGFEMMRSQSGQIYHGGTLTHNFPMRKLFESHGCKVFCEMEEWQFAFKTGDQ